MNNIALINSKAKKKPHNIVIKNNRNEPKTRANMRYSDKQNYRRYKTKTEPKLYERITIDEEDDLIAKIRKEFGIPNDEKKANFYDNINVSGAEYIKDPEPVEGERIQQPRYIYDFISDVSKDDTEELIGQLMEDMISQLQAEGGEEEEEEGGSPAPLGREMSGMTELSTMPTLATEDIYDMALRYGITYPGRKPTNPAAIEAREREIREKIAEMEANRGAAKK
jgi:hypothetical protein